MAKTPENRATATARAMQVMKNLRLIASHLLRFRCFVVAFVVVESVCHRKIGCPIGVFEVINRVFHRLWGTSTQLSKGFPTRWWVSLHFPYCKQVFYGLSLLVRGKREDLSTPLSTGCGKLSRGVSKIGSKCRCFGSQPVTKPATFALFCHFGATNACRRGSKTLLFRTF